VWILYISHTWGQNSKLLPDTLVFCEGDSAYLEIKELPENNYSITWSTPYSIITNIKRIKALHDGKYMVKVSYPRFKMPQTDSTFVKIFSKQKSIVRDTVMCRGKFIYLDKPRHGLRNSWNTGEITARIKVFNPGKYYVHSNYGTCTVTDTFKVKWSPILDLALPTETVFCHNNAAKNIQVNGSNELEYLWSNGSKTSAITVVKEGNYWLKTTYKQCGSFSDTIHVKFKACDCEILIPNSFTPNDDFKNDYFFPVLSCEYTYFSMLITDRWGNTVFASNNVNAKWDGKYKGNLCAEDIYIYKIESTEKSTEKHVTRSGHIALFR
jgi:gliding motility-associated-like protein